MSTKQRALPWVGILVGVALAIAGPFGVAVGTHSNVGDYSYSGHVDLRLDKSAPASVGAGDEVQYTITVTNDISSDAATEGWIFIFDDFSLEPDEIPPECESDGGGFDMSCRIDEVLDPGESYPITYTVTAQGFDLNNEASVSYDAFDPQTGNNQDSVHTDVVCGTNECVDLKMEKSRVDAGSVQPGDLVDYRLRVINQSSPAVTATNVVVRDFPSVTATDLDPGCVEDPNDFAYICTLSSLPAGQDHDFFITVEAEGSDLINYAEVASDQFERTPDDNSDSVDTAVDCPPEVCIDLSLEKGASESDVAPGDTVDYDLFVVNNSTTLTANNIVVTDFLPKEFEPGSESAGCIQIPGGIECSAAQLAPGFSVSFEYSIVADGFDLENFAEVRADEPDPDDNDNQADTFTEVNCGPTECTDVGLDKLGPATAPANGIVTYTLRVSNNGDNAAADIEVADNLPGDVVPPLPAGCQQPELNDPRFVLCLLPTLAEGATHDFVIKVRAGTVDLTNTAHLETDTPDTDPTNHDASIGTDIAFSFRPDGMVRRASKPAFIGNNIYNLDGQNQRAKGRAKQGKGKSFIVAIQNDGNVIDSFRLKGPGGNNEFKVKYKTLTGFTIASQVKAGTYLLSNLAPGAVRYIKVIIKAKDSSEVGDKKSVLVTATSVGNPARKDAVKARLKVKA